MTAQQDVHMREVYVHVQQPTYLPTVMLLYVVSMCRVTVKQPAAQTCWDGDGQILKKTEEIF